MRNIILVGALLLFVGAGCTSASIDAPGESGGETVPAFSFESYSGEVVSNTNFHGKPHVINSWASWCVFCKRELVDFAELQEEFPNVPIIAINRGESEKTARKFTDDRNISDDLIYLLDPDDDFYRDIAGFAMPETLFVNSSGDVVLHKRGVMSLENIREQMAQL